MTTTDPLSGHDVPAAQQGGAAEGKTSHGHSTCEAQSWSAVAADIPGGHAARDTQAAAAAGEHLPPATAMDRTKPTAARPWLADPVLALTAQMVEDLEKIRTAAENRLRQLIRGGTEDKDGDVRGFFPMPPGVCEVTDKKVTVKLAEAASRMAAVQRSAAVQRAVKALVLPDADDESSADDKPSADEVAERTGLIAAAAVSRTRLKHPEGWAQEVWDNALIVAEMYEAEKRAIASLERQVEAHALWPFAQGVPGLGAKQFGRLLGVIGDPYIVAERDTDEGVTIPAHPRNVAKLWALCGHGDPERKPFKGMTQPDAKALGSPAAKKRVRLIAMQALKYSGKKTKKGVVTAHSPYCDLYYEYRARYEGTVHAKQCQNHKPRWASPNGCGTSDHPEWGAPGSPLRDGHVHSNALRLVGKQFLKDLWLEARRLHQERDGLQDDIAEAA